MKTKKPEETLKKAVHVSGDLISTFTFSSEKKMQEWLKEEFPVLCGRYGPLTYGVEDIDPLKVGERCCVLGEGSDVFRIVKRIVYSPNRHGFLLDSGWTEEVWKCSREKKD